MRSLLALFQAAQEMPKAREDHKDQGHQRDGGEQPGGVDTTEKRLTDLMPGEKDEWRAHEYVTGEHQN
jgi:hypothetical protein